MDKDYSFTGYNPALKDRARELRANMTKQERRLWYDFLKTYPVRFYRQRIIDCYIADFYCAAAKLVIELDGAQHFSEDGKAYDENRTFCLKQHRLMVLRFSDAEIDRDFSAVCARIDAAVKARME